MHFQACHGLGSWSLAQAHRLHTPLSNRACLRLVNARVRDVKGQVERIVMIGQVIRKRLRPSHNDLYPLSRGFQVA
jgi:hypothetical protein